MYPEPKTGHWPRLTRNGLISFSAATNEEVQSTKVRGCGDQLFFLIKLVILGHAGLRQPKQKRPSLIAQEEACRIFRAT